jgi:hypothetical protein
MTAKWTDFVAGSVLTATQLNDVLDNFQDIAIFNETQAQNTAGGASTGTTWTKRTLNTTLVNNLGATLTTSVIALVAGTYEVEAISPFLAGNSVNIRLRNTTDSTTAIQGSNNYLASAAIVGGYAELNGSFTITGTKNFELQYYVQTGRASNGLGVELNATGVSEIYSIIKIRRIA